MFSLLADVAKRLTDAWFSRLALPGLGYVAALLSAVILGWPHAVDFGRLAGRLDDWTNTSSSSTGRVVLAVVGMFLTGAGAGLLAEGLGTSIGRIWACERWRVWPAPIRVLLVLGVRWRRAR